MVEYLINLHEIQPNDEAYQDVLHEFFNLAFPEYGDIFPSIRAEIQKGIDKNWGFSPHHWLILENGKPIGFALSRYLIQSNIGFFRYLAIDPNSQGKGIGYHVVQELKKQFQSDAQTFDNPEPLGYCFEVEIPELSGNEEERFINQRRLDFFVKKCAAIVLNVDYFEPVIVDDESANEKPKPMILMFQPIDYDFTKVDPDTTRKLVAAVWFEHYGIDQDDPTAQLMLNSILDNEV